MRSVSAICGCSKVVAKYKFGDGEYESSTTVPVLCDECNINDKLGKGYNVSSAWKNHPPGGLSKKTLDILAKGAAEAAVRKFEDSYGKKPMQFGKKRA